MAAERIYTIVPKEGDGKPRLVRATHPSTALSHVARQAFEVRVATQNDLEAFLPAGVKVEDVKAEQQALPGT
jgi:hypothetical protein